MIWRFIGTRHLVARRKQTLIAVLAVGLGIGIVLTSVALTNGFRGQLTDTTKETSPDISVTADGERIRTYQIYVSTIREVPGVTAVTPFITGNGVIRRKDADTAALVKGVEADAESEIFGFRDEMAEGSFTSIDGSTTKIVLGSGVAENIDAHVGDRVTLTTPGGGRELTVTGILHTGSFLDDRYMYLHLDTVQDMLDVGHAASGIDVGTSVEPEPVAVQIRGRTGLETETWREAAQSFAQVIETFQLFDYVFYSLILAIASAGIANVMLMTVMSKTREIGMLKSMGATDGDVMSIFLFEGAMLAAFGSVFGNVLAILLTEAIQMIEITPPEEGPAFVDVIRLNAELTVGDALFVSGFTVLLTLAFSVYPAWKAAKLPPVEALRRE
ncbi:MAG: hypothetical protein MAG715_00075 [Methanonatronarchaeales archaeon]|nr:hypothetical protein [Methanonatronarchaeales archaeon]